MTTNERLAACEAEIARLHGQVDVLTAAAAPSPRHHQMPSKVEDEGMTIRIEAPGARFAMPSELEMRVLYRAVLDVAPVLRSPPHRFDTADASFDRFSAAFRAIGGIGRLNKIDDGKALGWWIDEAKHVLASQGSSGDIDSQSFVAAILAHGDVPYRPLDRFPHDLGFGLCAYGGVPARDAWRNVCASGRPLAPTTVATTGNYPTPRTTIG